MDKHGNLILASLTFYSLWSDTTHEAKREN